MKVHPAASVFPMMSDEELDDLAADIKTNGLQQPIVVQDKTLIDGRNRLAACKRADVTPEMVELDGEDPVAFILSANTARRHMTKGQRAMVASVVESTTGRQAAKLVGVSQEYVSHANQIRDYAPDLVDGVIAGVPLDPAYQVALSRKRQAKAVTQVIRELRADAPDLAEQVDAKTLKLDDARAALASRRKDAEDRQRRHAQYLEEFTDTWDLVRDFAQHSERDQVLGYMADAHRVRFLKIEEAGSWTGK